MMKKIIGNLFILWLCATQAIVVGQNTLGNNLELGGNYSENKYGLFVYQSDWAAYGTVGKVKSGWLYCNEYGSSHAVVFFKVQVNDDGTGVIYLNGCANPKSTVWLKTFSGIAEHGDFCWDCKDGLSSKSWQFKWK
jgi:hypothetical protein